MEWWSRGGGNEYARTAEERILAWTRARMELARVQELAQTEDWRQAMQAQTKLTWVQSDWVRDEWERATPQAQKEQAQEEWAWAQEEWAWVQEEAQEEEELTQAQKWLAWAKAQAQKGSAQKGSAQKDERSVRAMWEREWAQAREWVQTEVEVQAEVRVRVRVRVRAPQAAGRVEALAQALAQARARMADEIPLLVDYIPLLEWLDEQRVTPSLPHPPTYAEVLADLKIKAILDSIKPRCRQGLARQLWGHSEHWWLIQILTPVTRLPLELLQSILSTIIGDASNLPLVLMFVCKHWYTAVTGIWSPLKLGTRTPRDAVTRRLGRNPPLLDVVVDTEIDRGDFTPSEAAYEAIFAAIEATSRWRSLVVETFPGQADLPEHLVNRGLRRCYNATMSLLKTFKVKSACEMSPLLDRLLRILGTTASPELTTMGINSANVISFLAPAYPPIFRSVKVLTLDVSGRHNPVDLLPHLHQLEELTASHLSIPIYPDHIDLPFVTTLRHLTLRAVSVQWMSGRTFGVLESCTISFPRHPHIPPMFRTTLPNCKHLTYQGYHLDILGGVSAHKLNNLSVPSSGSFNRRGDRQLVWLSSQILGEMRLAPQILHIGIEATSQAWIIALASMAHLEELVISNARPSSLRTKVLQSLIAQPVHASSTGTTSTSEKWDAPLCPSLRRFGLEYHRWLRPSEHFDLIPDFLSIIFSRWYSNCPLDSFSVWMRSDQEDQFELIQQRWWINESIVRLLAEKSRIEGEDLLRIRHRAENCTPIVA